MIMDDHTQEHTIQVWPSGRGYRYRGDPNGPREQRQLQTHDYNAHSADQPAWRDGQPDEWREILHSVRAEMYQARDVLCCDSCLVDDLLKQAHEPNDLGAAFSYAEIRNLYPDPDSFDAEACTEWLTDHGHEVPSATRQTSCALCDLDIEGTIGEREWRDRGNNTHCPAPAFPPFTAAQHEPVDAVEDQDEYLREMREAVREGDPEPAEVMEWWRISSWLCDQLHAIGEVTIDNGYGQWWGRCATGQGYIMDGVLQRVAAQFDTPAEAAS